MAVIAVPSFQMTRRKGLPSLSCKAVPPSADLYHLYPINSPVLSVGFNDF